MSAPPFQRLLLATEGGEFDAGAESLALAYCARHDLALHAVMPLARNPEVEAAAPAWAARADAEASSRREALVARAQAAGVALEVSVRRGPEPYLEIVEQASAGAHDLIVIRRRGQRGFFANLLVGEMVSKVVAHAPCSLLIAPRASQLWQHGVLLGLDPQQDERGALEVAAQLAAASRLPLQLVCAITPSDMRAQTEAVLHTATHRARELGARARGELREGRVHQVLLDAAAAGRADLLVIGRHRRDSLPRAWIGGAAQKVVGLAESAVLVHVGAQPRGGD